MSHEERSPDDHTSTSLYTPKSTPPQTPEPAEFEEALELEQQHHVSVIISSPAQQRQQQQNHSRQGSWQSDREDAVIPRKYKKRLYHNQQQHEQHHHNDATRREQSSDTHTSIPEGDNTSNSSLNSVASSTLSDASMDSLDRRIQELFVEGSHTRGRKYENSALMLQALEERIAEVIDTLDSGGGGSAAAASAESESHYAQFTELDSAIASRFSKACAPPPTSTSARDNRLPQLIATVPQQFAHSSPRGGDDPSGDDSTGSFSTPREDERRVNESSAAWRLRLHQQRQGRTSHEQHGRTAAVQGRGNGGAGAPGTADDPGAFTSVTGQSLPRYLATLSLAYVAAPLVVLIVFLAIYGAAPLKLCNVDCGCTIGESLALMFTYGAVVHGSRFLFYAVLCETMIHVFYTEEDAAAQRSTREKWDIPSAYWVLRRRLHPWLLWVGATVVFLAMSGQAAHMPRAINKPILICCIAVPFLLYCTAKGRSRVAVPLVLLQLIPITFELLVPQFEYTEASRRVLMCFWPLIAFAIDRGFFYAMYLLLPNKSTPYAVKIIVAHAQAFYCQAVLCAMAFSVLKDGTVWLNVIFFVLLAVLEVVMQGQLLDRLFQRLAKSCYAVCSEEEYVVHPIEKTDFRFIGPQTRCVTFVLSVTFMVPLVLFKRWPLKIAVTDCAGTVHHDFLGMTFLVMMVIVITATTAAMLMRVRAGTMNLPLILDKISWNVLAAVYFALLCADSFMFAESNLKEAATTTTGVAMAQATSAPSSVFRVRAANSTW